MVKTRNENGNLGGNITKFSFLKKKKDKLQDHGTRINSVLSSKT